MSGFFFYFIFFIILVVLLVEKDKYHWIIFPNHFFLINLSLLVQ